MCLHAPQKSSYDWIFRTIDPRESLLLRFKTFYVLALTITFFRLPLFIAFQSTSIIWYVRDRCP